MKTFTLIGCLLFLVAACTREAGAARHTVDEYRANQALRQAVLQQCASDPGTLKGTPDCVNVQEAARLESYGSLRSSPPLGLDSKKKP